MAETDLETVVDRDELIRRVLESHDPCAIIRGALAATAEERGYWQGIPLPLTGETLVVEPTYPNAEGLMAIGREEPAPDPEYDDWRTVNRFWSDRLMSDVYVIRKPDGTFTWGRKARPHALNEAITTMACSEAWGIEQESNALQTLATLLAHHAFKKYLLSGMFLETSKRSGIVYLFRKLRPTVAITPHDPSGELRILAALCLHPIAYYAGSWAGAMCPTDDVIAHLMLMRGDEALFWRRANHHPAIHPGAGL